MHWADKEGGIDRGPRALWEGLGREWKMASSRGCRTKSLSGGSIVQDKVGRVH
jgi:hypothetical protein